MKTGIITFEQFHGKKDVGSSRIRGHWIVKYWKQAGADMGDAEVYRYGAHYDVLIFQKAYWPEMAAAFKGVKILDICDPDWFHWGAKFMETLQHVDAVTCSSMELTKVIAHMTDKPVYFIPDRVDLSILPPPKEHYGPTKNAVWFGYKQNFPILHSAVQALARRGMSLTVVSDDVYVPPIGLKIELQNFPWNQSSYLNDILSGDVVLNPTSKTGKWKYKSDNKTSLAKALGMPVVKTDEELALMMTEEDRRKAAEEGLKEAKESLDVKLSVCDYKDVIQEILTKKQS